MSLSESCLSELDDPAYISKWAEIIDGVFMPKKFLQIQNDISDWEVNEDDVWVVSFPKTGTTWTQEMVWLIMNDLDYKAAEQDLLKRSPQLEATSLVRLPCLNLLGWFIPQPITDSLKYVRNMNSPACIKTHLPWNLLPKEIQKEIKKPKIVYISRNPKDTCVSYYYFSRLVKEFDGTLDEFCESFLTGNVHFAPFWNHVLPFWRRRKEPNILFLKYEELKADLPAAIRKTASFLGKKLTEAEVNRLADHLSFESMKNNSAVNYEWLVKMSNWITRDNNTFMRKGKVGGFKEVMTPEIIERFDKWTDENTKGTGLTYP